MTIRLSAENGKEAIEKAEQLHPDLIVLDLSMPVMNGLEAAHILSRTMPTVPLILYSTGTEFAEVTGNKSSGHGVFVETFANGDKATFTYQFTGAVADGKMQHWKIQRDEGQRHMQCNRKSRRLHQLCLRRHVLASQVVPRHWQK